MSDCRVHVIIPAYNCADYLPLALDSILAQTYSEFVVTVVDDCSTDQTAQVVNGYADARVRLVSNVSNMGLPGSVNSQMHAIECDYVARMDGDDIADPKRFAAQVAYLDRHREIDLLGTLAYRISSTGKVIGEFNDTIHPLEHEHIKASLVFGSPLLHPSIMLRRKSFVDYGPIFRPEAVPAADYDAWVRMATAGIMFANLPEPLMRYRVHDGQISTARQNHQKLIGDALRYQVLQEVVPDLSETFWNTHDAIRTRKWKKIDFGAMQAWFSFLRESNRQSSWVADAAMKTVLLKRAESVIQRHKFWSTAEKASYQMEMRTLMA